MMPRAGKQDALVEAAMDIVAEGGFANFSMKRVTERVGVSEAAIYKHFGTREGLLVACYKKANTEFYTLFENLMLVVPETLQEARLYGHNLWIRYFNWLVRNGNHTIFLFAFRNSEYMQLITNDAELMERSIYRYLRSIIHEFCERFGLAMDIPEPFIRAYLLDNSSSFATKIIRGELPDTVEAREAVWTLIVSGFTGLMHNREAEAEAQPE